MFPARTEKCGVAHKVGITALSDTRLFAFDFNAAVITFKQVQTLRRVSPITQSEINSCTTFVRARTHACVCVDIFFTGISEHFLLRRVDRKTPMLPQDKFGRIFLKPCDQTAQKKNPFSHMSSEQLLLLSCGF